MRGLIPIFILILGLTAREYADRHIPCGLEHADLDDLIRLVQATASTGVEKVLQHAESQRETRTVYRVQRRHRRHVDRARVREVVDNIAASYEKPEEVVQWYYGNQEMLSGVQSAVIEDQAVEWIMEHGGVEITDIVMSFGELVEQAKQSQG